ncbi:hypothetical protein [Lacticaseibacillus paracasei]|uniref:hypothetical protein n=1 Tax=Lacticaseibacillus paracasei TaxID=1597 RepID=UPI0036D3505D
MGYKNREILTSWANNVDTVAELTKHSSVRTASKSRLNDLLNTVSTGKIVGATEHRFNGKKMLSIHKLTTNVVPAFIECLGSPTQLPAFLKMFYPEMLQRKDYKSSCSIASSNILQMPSGRGSGASQAVKSLFVPVNKYDPWRDDKKLMADVWKAVNLIGCNQVTGHQLSKEEPGRGIYVTKDLIMDMLEHPEKATKTKIANALVLMRVAGAIHLAQPDELTDAGLKLTQFNNGSKLVKSHHVYILGDFNNSNWDLVAANFNLNLNTPISKEMLTQLFGEQVARDYFPDLSGGVGKREIDFFMTLKGSKGYTNEPIMTAKAAADTISSLASIKDRTSRQWVDQICNVKPVEMEKMSKSKAKQRGYLLGGFKDTPPAEKLIVPTTKEALRMCVENLAGKNEKLLRELKARMHKK